MKKLTLLFMALLGFTLLLGQSDPPKEVQNLIEKYQKAVAQKEIQGFDELFTPDAQIFGSAPEEKWSISFFLDIVGQAFANPDVIINHEVMDMQYIPLGPDQYLVLETSMFSRVSSRFPTRTIYGLRNSQEGWKIYFISFSLSPSREALRKLNKLGINLSDPER